MIMHCLLYTAQITGLRAFYFLCLKVTDNKKSDVGALYKRGGIEISLPYINNK